MSSLANKTIAVFCASRDGLDPRFKESATQLGETLGRLGAVTMTGGGRTGLMRAVIDGSITSHGKKLCIVAESIKHMEDRFDEAFEDSEIVSKPDLASRKQAFCDLADAFVVLPGGLGTLEEAIDVLSWSSVGFHAKHVVFVDIAGFYSPFEHFLRQAIAAGMVKADTMQALTVARDVPHCIEVLSQILV